MNLMMERNTDVMSTSTKRIMETMKSAGSMKHAGMMRNEINNIRGVSYGEGYAEGWSDGYDNALKNTKKLAMQCSVGGAKHTAEKELRPATHFLHTGQAKQLEKIVEECDEVVQAWDDGERLERIAEELADLQQACETMLAMMGFTEAQRREVRLNVIDKNSKRGYYMPPRDKYGN